MGIDRTIRLILVFRRVSLGGVTVWVNVWLHGVFLGRVRGLTERLAPYLGSLYIMYLTLFFIDTLHIHVSSAINVLWSTTHPCPRMS